MTLDDEWLHALNRCLEDIERRMAKVEEIAFAVQAEWTTKKVDKWAEANLDPNPPKVRP